MTPQDGAHGGLMPAPASGVTVRMYNMGFGDCLLLALRGDDGAPRYMLIDCGVHHDYPDGPARADKVAQDIMQSTGGRLHVLVATHEHTDHLYGFKYARDKFASLNIDELWLAWTEDPSDTVAGQLKKQYGMQVAAARAAAQQLAAAGHPAAPALQALLDFEFPDALAAAGGNQAQLDFLRQRSARKLQRPEDYRRPGEQPLRIPGVAGVKVYVLGPPRKAKWIKMLEKADELYPEMAPPSQEAAFAVAALASAGPLQGEDRDLFNRSLPFDAALMISKEDAAGASPYARFFRARYGFAEGRDQGPAWRRIDADWLAAAERLALALNSKTNNTSLALAIELSESQPRKVLLFAADAQAGNWLSWRELRWAGEGPAGADVTVDDLLKRTVLYKVGHHGSRNATLSVKGLEQMAGAGLVALLPVDEAWAKGEMGWDHPGRMVLPALLRQTAGRVLRSDQIPSGNAPPAMPPEADAAGWADMLSRLDWDRGPDRLWIQVTVPA